MENRISELGRSQEVEINKNNVRIYENFTEMEHVAKIGFLVAPDVKFSNVQNYEKMIAERIGCN